MWINLQGKRICLLGCNAIEPIEAKDDNNDPLYGIRFDHEGVAVNALTNEHAFNSTAVYYPTEKQRDGVLSQIDGLLENPAVLV